jgi:hypothetical protein
VDQEETSADQLRLVVAVAQVVWFSIIQILLVAVLLGLLSLAQAVQESVVLVQVIQEWHRLSIPQLLQPWAVAEAVAVQVVLVAMVAQAVVVLMKVLVVQEQ